MLDQSESCAHEMSFTAHEDADLSLEIKRRVRLMQACLKRCGPGLYDRTAALRPAKPESLHAESRGDRNPAVQERDVDHQRRTLRQAPNTSSCESLDSSPELVPTAPLSHTRKPSR